MNNFTGLLCESCRSHIIFIEENEQSLLICSYCGSIPDDILPLYNLEEVKYIYEQKENLQSMWKDD